MSRVRGILLHVCVVCSFVCITAKILDWYNPYMNFTGHIWGIQMVLYLAVIILGATRTYLQTKHRISCYMLFLEVTFVYPSRIPETV